MPRPPEDRIALVGTGLVDHPDAVLARIGVAGSLADALDGAVSTSRT